jgi:hypothetical protein
MSHCSTWSQFCVNNLITWLFSCKPCCNQNCSIYVHLQWTKTVKCYHCGFFSFFNIILFVSWAVLRVCSVVTHSYRLISYIKFHDRHTFTHRIYSSQYLVSGNSARFELWYSEGRRDLPCLNRPVYPTSISACCFPRSMIIMLRRKSIRHLEFSGKYSPHNLDIFACLRHDYDSDTRLTDPSCMYRFR